MVDIVIITAIYEEYRAVLDILERPESPVLPKDNPILFGWRIGHITSQRFAGPYSVVVAQCSEQTQVPSAMTTMLTVQRFRPRYVVFCGIAGGINSGSALPEVERLKQFDLLLASVVWGYEYGKVKKSFQPRPDLMFRADPHLKQAAEIFGKSDNRWGAKVEERLHDMNIELERRPHLVVGPVASGEKVVDDLSSTFFKPVLKLWPKLRGVEMEGAGAAAAVELLNSSGIHTRYLMVRGISDLPQGGGTQAGGTQAAAPPVSERDAGKIGAAIAAAEFLKEFIATGWPQAPLSEIEDPGPSPYADENTPNYDSLARSQVEDSLEEKIIFYMADRELHENSGIQWGKSFRSLYERLLIEFRLIFLSMNTEGTIVFPPTYYLETPALRMLCEDHLPLMEAGFIKFTANTPILSDYLDEKRERYQKAAKFDDYFESYFSDRKLHGIYDLPIQITGKFKSIGLRTLAAWKRSVLGRIQLHPGLIVKTQRFLDLADKTERRAFLYENLREHQQAVGLNMQEIRILDDRATMNRFYLLNYLSLGFTVPEASSFAWDSITWHLPKAGLNLPALHRMINELQLTASVLNADALTLIKWRSSEPVRMLFRSARGILRQGRSLTEFVLKLIREPYLGDLQRGFALS